MAIGTTAAIIGAGVLGAGASFLAGKSNSKAIGRASDAQAESSAAAIAAQERARSQNVAIQTPFLNTGMAAMAQRNALLGLNVPQTAAPLGGGAGGPTMTEDQWAQGALDALAAEVNPSIWAQVRHIQDPSDQLAALQPRIFRRDREVLGNYLAQNPRPRITTQPVAQVPANQQATQPTAQQAFNQFKNYTGYTHRLQEGQNALNSGYAARGTLQSGAALQALQEHGQEFASNEFMKYFALLGDQQNLGPGAANALSGVNTNYANNAANIAINQGNNAANAAIAQGNNNAGMIQGIGGAMGGILGGLAFPGTSYSDRRLKTKIKLLRRDDDGLGWYEFAYQTAPDEMLVGVMADEVKALRPKAYSEDARGYGMVNYAELAA